LPHLTPYPGPNSVIVLDNASIHKNHNVYELLAACGVRIEFLSPYSPDYNPVRIMLLFIIVFKNLLLIKNYILLDRNMFFTN